MPAATYPVDTRFAFRPGVTCLTTPAGAVLLSPPRSQKLSRLTAVRQQALKTLNAGPATVLELSEPAERSEVDGLIGDLTAGGWLSVTVRDGGSDLYCIQPFGQPPLPPSTPDRPVLSKFAVLHRDSGGLVLEHPLGWCDVRIIDPRLLVLLGGSVTVADLPIAVASRLIDDLCWAGILVADGAEDDFDALSWSVSDLWFHRRSSLGERTAAWEHFGPTKWAKDRFSQPSARRPAYPGPPLALPIPDLDAARVEDPTLTAVLEDRVSTRAFDAARPISIDQLAELLYRTARTRNVQSVGPGEELLSRPYPSSGGVYELEVYPVVREVTGLERGMYHYDSFEHLLRPVAAGDEKSVARLIEPAAATLAGGAEPQVVLVIAARCGRVMWTYEQVSYALILKDVGVLIQTIYLAATAMGLGACAQGFSDTAAFVAATGVDERQESSVGSIVIGSPRQP
ncbi:dehydrogenase [Mycolicibacterium sp. GF69]|uniref:SagB family peptide dehydrogenase n=1 Tax=Mycolicibacterium sp. GF69 TaxID=2267251 RepID=UPI000DCE294C|nr:SagB family peptide dehydrogenase [Mycolicibacterium sp. GF69]MBY0288869.1 SagB family peptide dehydrogenase [Mycobacteriaceae bacterium]RAV07376.1 dehydrogenase [Mycolicibacterium sp. GF69]